LVCARAHWLWPSNYPTVQIQCFISKGFKKFTEDVKFALISQNFKYVVKNRVQICMRGLKNMHAKIRTCVLLRKQDLMFVDFRVVDKTYILEFLNSTPFACIEFAKLETFAFSIGIDQNCIASLKCKLRVHFLAKLSDSNWRSCIFSALSFLHFQFFNLSLKVTVVQKYSNSALLLHIVQKVCVVLPKCMLNIPHA